MAKFDGDVLYHHGGQIIDLQIVVLFCVKYSVRIYFIILGPYVDFLLFAYFVFALLEVRVVPSLNMQPTVVKVLVLNL